MESDDSTIDSMGDDPIGEFLLALLAIFSGLGLGVILGGAAGGLGAWALANAGLPPWAIATSLGAAPAAVAARWHHPAPSRGRGLRAALVGGGAAALIVVGAPQALPVVGVVAGAIAGALAGIAVAISLVDAADSAGAQHAVGDGVH